MSHVSVRTPISILQEVCAKRGLSPVFELVSNEGQVHDPIYVYQCTAGSITAVAKGCSKKKAKHQASYLVLLQLLGANPTAPHEKTALRDLRLAAAATLGLDYGCPLDGGEVDFAVRAPAIDPKVNSVGELQEYCQKNMWPSPVYEFNECLPSLTDGYKYHCTVKLWKWKCSGFGASKKEAKRKAAADFLKAIIDNCLSIPVEELEAIEEDNLPLLEKKDLNSLKDRQSNNEKAAKSVRKLLSGVFTSRGKLPQLNLEGKIAGDTDVYRTLDTILEKHKLTVTYSIVKLTNSGKVYCQAQLSTIPPQVVASRPSATAEEARMDAAYRCIIYLNIMTMPAPLFNDAWFRKWPLEVGKC
nr:unnamed protein product [Spirometra erinaceieuropaei]